jgi:glyoxylate reductase
MINESSLEKFKQNSYLINTARGPIVDEHALVHVLRTGRLKGAALDVFDNEPNVNPELVGMENVVLTPHIASATVEAREKMCDLAVSAIEKIIKNEKPDTLVNPEIWDQRRQ